MRWKIGMVWHCQVAGFCYPIPITREKKFILLLIPKSNEYQIFVPTSFSPGNGHILVLVSVTAF